MITPVPLQHVYFFGLDETVAQVCICLFDELKEGRKTGLGRELLFPRKAEIAAVIPIVRVADIAPHELDSYRDISTDSHHQL